MNKKIVIIGAGGHGKVVADIARKSGYTDVVFLDDYASAKEINGYPIAGTVKDVARFADCDFFVAIGNGKIREKLQTSLKENSLSIATLIHPNAVIGENVSIGEGTVVMAGAVINPSTNIGKGCIINTCASVDHDCEIGDYAHISVAAHTAGTVKIGRHTWLGIGSIVSNNLSVTADCIIGAGAVVVKDIHEPGTYVGVPARKIIDHNETE